MCEIESQSNQNEARQSLLQLLKERMAQLQQQQPNDEIVSAESPEKNSADFAESAGSALQPQQFTTGSDPGSADSAAVLGGSDPGPLHSAPPVTAQQFAAELDKLDPDLREAASDLYEHLHYKSNFAKLSAVERDAVLELLKHHAAEKVARIVSQPPPIGMRLQTSKTGLNRFRDDYMRCAMQASKAETRRHEEEQRLAAEQSFQKASASDETFRQTTERQIRKLLFTAINNSGADYHEIRWLLKSLELLRKPQS